MEANMIGKVSCGLGVKILAGSLMLVACGCAMRPEPERICEANFSLTTAERSEKTKFAATATPVKTTMNRMLVSILPEDDAESTTYFDVTDEAMPAVEMMMFKTRSRRMEDENGFV